MKEFSLPRHSDARLMVRQVALQSVKRYGIALELYAGRGEITSFIAPYFSRVIRVDMDAQAKADYFMTAEKFVDSYLAALGPVDYVDLDPYGSASHVLESIFYHIDAASIPFVLVYGDAYTLALKRGARKLDWEKQYRVTKDDDVNFSKPWSSYGTILSNFVMRLASEREWQSRVIASRYATQGGRKSNYLVVGFEITKK